MNTADPTMNTAEEHVARMLRSGTDAGQAGQLARLRARLADHAAAAGFLDVAYRTLDTALGPLLLAATPRGLVRIAYACQDHDAVLAQLAGRISPRVLRAPARLDAAARQIGEYLAGQRASFDLPVDLRLARGYRRTVLTYLPAIGYGRTASYAAVAAATGNPKAVRAAGTACATNPLPLVIPCHRVIRSDGTLGAYAGGTEAKRTLLDLEAAGHTAG
ncbi:MAG TPA: methylated-DNA--[protein]-cysteine S-methyltransferase [Streptosporangiaceae bacterium]|nr:methylated-DNA--[protein]-cysteine S-methyltransferase [Streptosporangiaceae bacterium]